MKSILFILMLAPTLLMQPDMAEISQAISKGDVATLSKFFDSSVEISILEDEDIYDKAQAVAIVNNFFKSNQPQSFSEVHKGTSKGNDSHYVIGNLKAGSSTYRVYLYMKENKGKYLIQELRFDRE